MEESHARPDLPQFASVMQYGKSITLGENGVKTKQIDKMSTEDVLAEIPVHPLGTDTYESCYIYVSGMTSS